MESVLLELCLVCLVSSYRHQNVVNVALNKLAKQSTTHDAFKHPGSAAVDDETPGSGQKSEFETCIHTSEYPRDISPWWEVDLGQPYPVVYITIHARPKYLEKMQATTITIDNRDCFTISTVPDTSPFDVTCTRPLTGQKVRLTRKSSTADFSLNICESATMGTTVGTVLSTADIVTTMRRVTRRPVDVRGVHVHQVGKETSANSEQYSFLHQAVLEAYSGLNSQLSLTQFDPTFSNSFRRTSAKATIDLEFENLQLMKDRRTEPGYITATLPENRYKNRNMNALPPDSHLAYLTTHVKGRNNYISAVFAPTLHNAQGRILTQLPLADTMQDLWRLVESFGVITIVSLGRVDWFEKDSSPYWPMADGETMQTGSYTLTLLTKTVLGPGLQSYTIKWERKRALGEVRLLQYSDWQGEFPSNSDDLVCLLQVMQEVLRDHKQNPFIIQCMSSTDSAMKWFSGSETSSVSKSTDEGNSKFKCGLFVEVRLIQ